MRPDKSGRENEVFVRNLVYKMFRPQEVPSRSYSLRDSLPAAVEALGRRMIENALREAGEQAEGGSSARPEPPGVDQKVEAVEDQLVVWPKPGKSYFGSFRTKSFTVFNCCSAIAAAPTGDCFP